MKQLVQALAPLCIAVSLPAAAAAQSAPPASSAPVLQVGLITLGLQVADLQRSLRFYVEGLGLKALSQNQRGDTIEQFLGFPGMPSPPVLELIAPRTPGARAALPAAKSFKIVLAVSDAAAVHAQLVRAGFAPPPVRTNPVTRSGFFFATDPDGYSLEIVQRPMAPGSAR